MRRVRTTAIALASTWLVVACGAQPRSSPRLADADRVHDGPEVKQALELAPQAVAHAEDERKLAKKAYDDGDDLSATMHADRAIAAYEHAFILARRARATRELADASAALSEANERARTLQTSRAEIDRDGEALEKRLEVARQAATPVPSGPADGQREAARRVAARSLVTEARLLCTAAKLVAPAFEGLADAQKNVDALDATFADKTSSAPTPIDDASRARARCLDRLSRARRASSAPPGQADTLLTELSAAGSLSPSRDERGVVVTLRDVFKGDAITPAAQTALAELGRVAAAHADVGIEVVVHDAVASTDAKANAASAARADAVAKALVSGGATAARIATEAVGARIPVVDPADAAHRARNARVEIVFVPSGE